MFRVRPGFGGGGQELGGGNSTYRAHEDSLLGMEDDRGVISESEDGNYDKFHIRKQNVDSDDELSDISENSQDDDDSSDPGDTGSPKKTKKEKKEKRKKKKKKAETMNEAA